MVTVEPLKKLQTGDKFLIAQLSVPQVTPVQERQAAQVVALCVPRHEVTTVLGQLGLLTPRGALRATR